MPTTLNPLLGGATAAPEPASQTGIDTGSGNALAPAAPATDGGIGKSAINLLDPITSVAKSVGGFGGAVTEDLFGGLGKILGVGESAPSQGVLGAIGGIGIGQNPNSSGPAASISSIGDVLGGGVESYVGKTVAQSRVKQALGQGNMADDFISSLAGVLPAAAGGTFLGTGVVAQGAQNIASGANTTGDIYNNDVQQAILDKVRSGEWTVDQAADYMNQSGVAINQNQAVTMATQQLLDPMTWTGGMGVLEKAGVAVKAGKDVQAILDAANISKLGDLDPNIAKGLLQTVNPTLAHAIGTGATAYKDIKTYDDLSAVTKLSGSVYNATVGGTKAIISQAAHNTMLKIAGPVTNGFLAHVGVPTYLKAAQAFADVFNISDAVGHAAVAYEPELFARQLGADYEKYSRIADTAASKYTQLIKLAADESKSPEARAEAQQAADVALADTQRARQTVQGFQESGERQLAEPQRLVNQLRSFSSKSMSQSVQRLAQHVAPYISPSLRKDTTIAAWAKVTGLDAADVEARLAKAGIKYTQKDAELALGAAHGQATKDLLAAKEAVTPAEAKSASLDTKRLTIVSERTFTAQDKRVLQQAIASRNLDLIEQMVAQKDMLAERFGTGLPDLKQLKQFLQQLPNDSLVNTLKDSAGNSRNALPAALEAWKAKWGTVEGSEDLVGKRLGFEPPDAWKTVTDEDGNQHLTRPFVPMMGDPGGTLVYRNGLGRMMDGLTRSVQNTTLANTARFRLTNQIVTHGGAEQDARRFFNALQAQVVEQKMPVRGLAGLNPDFWDKVYENSAGPQALRAFKAGGGDTQFAVLKAFEGNWQEIGLTQKLTGVLKSESQRAINRVAGPGHTNPIAFVADDLYPRFRFKASPIFQLQQSIESGVFNMLRGVRPAVIDPDVKAVIQGTARASRNVALAYEEYTPAFMAGHEVIDGMVGPQASSRLIGGLRKLANVQDFKNTAMVNQVAHDAGPDFVAVLEQQAPRQLAQLRVAFGNDPAAILAGFIKERFSFASDDGSTIENAVREIGPGSIIPSGPIIPRPSPQPPDALSIATNEALSRPLGLVIPSPSRMTPEMRAGLDQDKLAEYDKLSARVAAQMAGHAETKALSTNELARYQDLATELKAEAKGNASYIDGKAVPDLLDIKGRLVTPEEHDALEIAGRRMLGKMQTATRAPLTHFNAAPDDVAKDLYQRTMGKEWDGATYDPHTGVMVEADKESGIGPFAGAHPNSKSFSMPVEQAKDPAAFQQGLDKFMADNEELLKSPYAHIGTFWNAETNTVEFDVSMVSKTPQDAEALQIARGASARPGGAYDFTTGNGVFAPRAYSPTGGVAQNMKDTFNLSGPEAQDVAAVTEARAKAWASETGRPASEFVPAHIAAMGRGGAPKATDLQQASKKVADARTPEEYRAAIEQPVPQVLEDAGLGGASHDVWIQREGMDRPVDIPGGVNASRNRTDNTMDPGLTQGRFTHWDMWKIKNQLVDPKTLPQDVGDAVYQKMFRSVSDPARYKDPIDTANRLAFATMSPGTNLHFNEGLMGVFRIKDEADLAHIASFAKDDMSVNEIGRSLRSAFNLKELKLGATYDAGLGAMAKNMKLMLEHRADMLIQPGETAVEYSERLASMLYGSKLKVANFATMLGDPEHFPRGTIDRVMMKDLDAKGVLPADLKAKYFTPSARGGEWGAPEPQEIVFMKKGVVNPEVPDHLKNLDPALVTNNRVVTYGGDYQRVNEILDQQLKDSGRNFSTGGYQWREWDARRGLLSPHTSVLPGLERLPKMDQQELAGAVKASSVAGMTARKAPEARKAVGAAGFFYQGPKGAVQFLDDSRAIVKGFGTSDVSTAFHELGHVFRRTLAPQEMADVEKYYKITDGVWTVQHEERFAYDFERYMGSGKPPTPALAGVFERAKQWLVDIYHNLRGSPGKSVISPEMQSVFDRMLTTPEDRITAAYAAGNIEEGQNLNKAVGVARGGSVESGGAVKASIPKETGTTLGEAHTLAQTTPHAIVGEAVNGIGMTAADVDTVNEGLTYAVSKAQAQAWKTHYIDPGRSFLNRSLNHPFLGLYPVSYMWGKVVPEFTRFLLTRPFGLNAPLLGFTAMTRIQQAVAGAIANDPGLSKWVASNPDLIYVVNLLLPSQFTSINVNAPAWARHIAQNKPGAGNPGQILSDTATSIGLGRDISNAFGVGVNHPGKVPAGAVFEAGNDIQSFANSLLSQLDGAAKAADIQSGVAPPSKQTRLPASLFP